MFKFLSLISFILYLIIFPIISVAHTTAQLSYFKINGVYTNPYPITSTSVTDFQVPQDSTPQAYLINQTLNFALDTTRLPVPLDTIQKGTLTWNFGDEATAQGLANTHTYSKIGTYLLTINLTVPGDTNQYPIQSIFLNIVPNKNYQLPKPQIKVNGQTVSSGSTVLVDLSQSVKLEADLEPQNDQVIEYAWDLGDGNSSSQKSLSHNYVNTQFKLVPILRIKDSQGFIVDTSIVLSNQPSAKFSLKTLSIDGGIVILLALAAEAIILKKRSRFFNS